MTGRIILYYVVDNFMKKNVFKMRRGFCDTKSLILKKIENYFGMEIFLEQNCPGKIIEKVEVRNATVVLKG